jgi:hypothetical protein
LNVGVLDNLNGTPSELLEYLNADRCHPGGMGDDFTGAGPKAGQVSH